MKVENKNDNFENDGISRLLGSLKRVDAPGDFDFRVKARIAAGRLASGATWLPMTTRVAAALLVILVVGYVGFRVFRSPAIDQAPVASVPVVADQALVQRDEDQGKRAVISASNDQTNGPMAVKPPETSAPREADFAVKRPVIRTVSSTRGGGSRDSALGITHVISAPDRTRHLTKETLSGLGIDANNTGSGWIVGEVKPNSRAERSGLKAGDVIESVKNKSVRVRRDGKIVQIELKP
jgi:membrane-associated protease RseP (regulator of RpoE activity)